MTRSQTLDSKENRYHTRPRGLLRAARLVFFLILVSLFLPDPAFCSPSAYQDELVQKARLLGLHEKRQWHVLIHYRESLFRGYESLIDDPDFFLSKKGKYDPASELEATIRSFFRTDVNDDLHPRCRFTARYSWLKGELGLEEALLPAEDCKGFNELYSHLKPESAVLIFPVSHMNSPASMFGHTLLRIDSASENKLFSYAVNYSAITSETNGILFAFKGIFGFYEGYFGILPYYEKIKEYSSLENRDIWEYRLNFSKEEVGRMVEHIWELKDIYSDYYFFDENCSYNLLLVLEAGRPELDLSEALPPWVIPMDTIRVVKSNRLDAGSPVYRPSKASKIKHIEWLLKPVQQARSMDIAYGGASPEEVLSDGSLGTVDKARILDLAAEYIQYRYSKKIVQREEYIRSYLKTLGVRSRLGQAGGAYEVASPEPPEAGHPSGRLALGMGTKEGASFNVLKIRPANHDLTDPDEGYLPGAAISFLDTELRYNYTERKLSLESLRLVDITSIAERDRFFKPVSWKISAEVAREEFSKREHRTVFRLVGGPGLSYRLSKDGLAFVFMEPEVKAGSGLDDGYSAGAGIRAGFLKHLTRDWKALFALKAAAFGPGDAHTVISAELNQSFSINERNAARLDLKRERFEGFYSTEAVFSWNRYF